MSKLSGIPETMLITLWAKAEEAKKEAPIFVDKKSLELINMIDYDFSKFKKSWLSQLGVAIRTKLIDDAVSDFISRKSEGVIINIGAGLDTRFERLNCKGLRYWYDIDLTESIAIRRRFFNESNRNKFIDKSIFDLSWIAEIEANDSPVMIIAEGVLMYFDKDRVKFILEALGENFPKAEMIIDTIPSFMAGKAKHHDSVKTLKLDNSDIIEFKWALDKPTMIEEMCSKIMLLNAWNYYDYYKKRWSWFGLINKIPWIRSRLSCRTIHFRFD